MATVVFSDTFTGTNGDAVSSTLWPTTNKEGSSSSSYDIQSNQLRLAASTASDDFAVVIGNSDTDLQDQEVSLYVDPSNSADNDNKWLYVMMRGDGTSVNANAGRPATAYYYRFHVGNTSDEAQDKLYRRISNTETSLVAALNTDATNCSRNADEPFYIKLKAVDSGSDVVLSIRMWDADATEPTGWLDYTDTSPGVLAASTGKLHILVRNFSAGKAVDVRVDDVDVTDPNLDTTRLTRLGVQAATRESDTTRLSRLSTQVAARDTDTTRLSRISSQVAAREPNTVRLSRLSLQVATFQPPPVAVVAKYWNGSAWTLALTQSYNGATWDIAPIKEF